MGLRNDRNFSMCGLVLALVLGLGLTLLAAMLRTFGPVDPAPRPEGNFEDGVKGDENCGAAVADAVAPAGAPTLVSPLRVPPLSSSRFIVSSNCRFCACTCAKMPPPAEEEGTAPPETEEAGTFLLLDMSFEITLCSTLAGAAAVGVGPRTRMGEAVSTSLLLSLPLPPLPLAASMSPMEFLAPIFDLKSAMAAPSVPSTTLPPLPLVSFLDMDTSPPRGALTDDASLLEATPSTAALLSRDWRRMGAIALGSPAWDTAAWLRRLDA
jgi:hypothetical protein